MTKIHRACDLDTCPRFKVGDPKPEGYLACHEWAAIQLKGGLRQTQCPACGLWKFPQQVCDHKAAGRTRRNEA